MDTPDTLNWFKSSRSGGAQNCLEVANGSDFTAVRDTKDREGGMLTISLTSWNWFISSLTPRS